MKKNNLQLLQDFPLPGVIFGDSAILHMRGVNEVSPILIVIQHACGLASALQMVSIWRARLTDWLSAKAITQAIHLSFHGECARGQQASDTQSFSLGVRKSGSLLQEVA